MGETAARLQALKAGTPSCNLCVGKRPKGLHFVLMILGVRCGYSNVESRHRRSRWTTDVGRDLVAGAS